MVGALKGLGNLAAAIIAEAFDLALIRLPGEAEERKRPLSRVAPILGSSRRMTGLLSPPCRRWGGGAAAQPT